MSSDPRDYKLDISGLKAPQDSAAGSAEDPAEPAATQSNRQPGSRPWLSVHFECCGVYQRIYRSADGTHYQGACPRCGGKIRFNVSKGGTSSRFFRVS
jgi:hypothetical protein